MSTQFNLVPPHATKGEAAQILYPDWNCDTALPQPWVDYTLSTTGFDVRPHFVWGYNRSTVFGQPLPLTATGADWLENTWSKRP